MEEKEKKEILGHMKRAGLAPPKMLTLMITNGCNLQCIHCWPQSRSPKTISPVPKGKLQRCIREFVELGCEEICLSGGEPLTHPDWFQILRVSCGLSGVRRVRLQTNATLLSGEDAKALASLGFTGLWIQVILEGATAAIHDRVCGSGSFDRTLRGLRLLVQAGLGKRTEVAFTEMRHNFQDLPQVLRLLDNLGVGRLVSGTLVRAGRAAKTDYLALPSPSQYRDLLARYHEDAEFRDRYEKMGTIACLEWLKGRFDSSTQNCACVERPYVDAEGRMYPCEMLPIEKYAVQGVYEQSVAVILRQGVSKWAELPTLYNRRSIELKACRSCLGRLHCGGGCLGRAYASTGDPMNVEDRCNLRKAVYSWEEPMLPGP